eukprot:TRINITY_DN2349_c1_g1_i10.p2 TRINITY_DN2349_c1_g1~~TRINITY_DN2349_c1_g1_i10.p2  ORF type:complete len:289 (-),score=22.34 TRINITY_DN2349_c1_g1_i10:770-1636(-)
MKIWKMIGHFQVGPIANYILPQMLTTSQALEEEADIQCEGDILWSTPLHLACERGDTNIVRVLLEQGAQWGATNSFGAAPIHLVAWSDKWNSVLVQLLENGADVNQRTISAELQQAAVPCLTPLHLAVSYEALSNVNTLLRYGADVNSQDNTGSTVLHYAVGKNLTQHPKNVSPLTQMLLNHKANVNLQNNVHKSPFWYSISSGHEALVSSFLQYNADLQQKDEKGRSVLHLAVLQGNWRIVDKLLKLGIESNVQDNEGNSPLQLAKSEGFVKIQNLLVQHKNLLQQQ